jgi:hypothetical protein
METNMFSDNIKNTIVPTRHTIAPLSETPVESFNLNNLIICGKYASNVNINMTENI